jgi:hypothetical protein
VCGVASVGDHERLGHEPAAPAATGGEAPRREAVPTTNV